MKKNLIALLALTLCLLLFACGEKKADEPDAPDVPDTPTVDPAPPEKTPEQLAEQRLNERIEGMTLEEKVGQLFFVRCPETDVAEDVKTYHLGGLLLFGRDYKDADGNWLSADDFTAKLASYQAAADLPLFIGSDEEGGTVTRASRNPNLFSSPLKSPQELYAAAGMDGLLEETLRYNERLKALGINVNFAPVCDVSTDKNDFIYARSFGKDAQTTADYIAKAVTEYEAAGVACVLKHFPGYGNNVDTHTGIAVDERSYETFETSDFLPFSAGIAAGAPFVLVSHNIVNCMDASLPASLSPKVHEILRGTLGFDGLIVTDDLAMDAVKSYAQDGSVAVLALQAGNDMIVTTDYQTQIPQVIAAVQAGEIDEREIDAHVYRVLHEKQTLGLID
jgi:beta-N-acetylhexosaminidase